MGKTKNIPTYDTLYNGKNFFVNIIGKGSNISHYKPQACFLIPPYLLM